MVSRRLAALAPELRRSRKTVREIKSTQCKIVTIQLSDMMTVTFTNGRMENRLSTYPVQLSSLAR